MTLADRLLSTSPAQFCRIVEGEQPPWMVQASQKLHDHGFDTLIDAAGNQEIYDSNAAQVLANLPRVFAYRPDADGKEDQLGAIVEHGGSFYCIASWDGDNGQASSIDAAVEFCARTWTWDDEAAS